MDKLSSKSKRFNKVLLAAKEALDSIDIEFHLSFGSALGAIRQADFIPHDNDIDLGVFYKDVNTQTQVRKIKKAMENVGFTIKSINGKLNQGFEIQFEMNNIPLDIFWIYSGEYRGKKYAIVQTFFGPCDNLEKKTCVFAFKPFKTEKIKFHGTTYNIVPKSTLVDMYGSSWNIPKKYDYDEGITEGHATGLIKDYFNPRPTDQSIAFCFLLYSKVDHKVLWEKFFNQDDYPIKSYNIYAHLKEETKETPKWIAENKVKSVPTGWCVVGLVYAFIQMLRKALKNTDNKYFVFLSGSCVPLYDYQYTYDEIFSSKRSRIDIRYDEPSYTDDGLYYASQWCILNRKNAEMLVKLQDTKEGKNFVEEILPQIEHNCPDEIVPVNWFIKKYGKPSSPTFKKEFKDTMTTFTMAYEGASHPVKFNSVSLKKSRREICGSSALFARKFNNKAAREIAMQC